MGLAEFASVDRSALRWLRTSESPIGFTLSSDSTSVARLEWRAPRGSYATAVSASASWTLKRGGFLNPHVMVRESTTGQEVARLSVHFNYHRIDLTAGGAYRFHRVGVLVPAWQIRSEEGGEILHIEPVREGRKLAGGAVLSAPAAADRPELLLLMVVAWYFIVLAWFEDEALVPLEGAEEPGQASPTKSS